MSAVKKTTKKASVKRAPGKKATVQTSVRRVNNRASASQNMRSFRLSKVQEPFLTFRITHQTVYWSILAILVLALGLWVVDINDRVQRIYDQVDSINRENKGS